MEFFDSFPFTKLQGKNRGLDWVIQKINEFKKVVDNIPETVDEAVTEKLAEVSLDDIGAAPATHLEDKNNPHEVTAEQAGAVPIGYGFGEEAVSLSENLLADETALNTALETVYGNMSARETKIIRFGGYPSGSDYNWFGILFKSSANYGSFIAHSAFNSGTLISKAKTGGVWQALEWLNPPMIPGVEYRTTERYNNNPVYTKRFDFSALGVAYGNVGSVITSGAITLLSCEGIAWSDGTSSFPFPLIRHDTNGIVIGRLIVYPQDSNPAVYVRSFSDDLTAWKAKVIVKYTKN